MMRGAVGRAASWLLALGLLGAAPGVVLDPTRAGATSCRTPRLLWAWPPDGSAVPANFRPWVFAQHPSLRFGFEVRNSGYLGGLTSGGAEQLRYVLRRAGAEALPLEVRLATGPTSRIPALALRTPGPLPPGRYALEVSRPLRPAGRCPRPPSSPSAWPSPRASTASRGGPRRSMAPGRPSARRLAPFERRSSTRAT